MFLECGVWAWVEEVGAAITGVAAGLAWEDQELGLELGFTRRWFSCRCG